MSSHDETRGVIERIQDLASNVGGAVGGAIVGLFVEGPAGAPAGAATGAASGALLTEATRKVIGDVAGRFLSQREHVRIADAAFHAAQEIATRIESGEEPRQDGFFDRDADCQSPAEELFEGVLMKCKNEHEERKTRHLGLLFANAAFSTLPPLHLNTALRMAERMSYRQFCLLALCVRAEELGFDSLKFSRLRSHGLAEDAYFLDAEWRELRSASIGVVEPETGNDGPAIRPLPVGLVCYELLGLSRLPQEEIQDIVKMIQNSTK